ncbi:hypothetical protein AB4510_04390 [Vibrio sp. 10N.222.54.B12]|uniref:hypothetical protein n=1 Tax=unclassified Vibrio TaxID=2614977 RepID=UPI0010BCF910|nr:hypothetical protein [Vibrio sp. F13]TKF54506.1 hypothetical protein FCV60_09355 [Vibrio sp. F13]
MLNKTKSIIATYKRFSINSLFMASFYIALNRLMKVVIMIVPLQFVLIMGTNSVPHKLQALLPDFLTNDLAFLLVLMISGFVFLLLSYMFVNYKSTSCKKKSLAEKHKEYPDFIKSVNKAKEFFSKSVEVQADILLNVFCLSVIAVFNVPYFIFCTLVVAVSLYIFDELLVEIMSKNIEFYTEVYSLVMYIIMVGYLAYTAYTHQGNILHLVPIFFVSRMIVVSIPRLTKNITSIKKFKIVSQI